MKKRLYEAIAIVLLTLLATNSYADKQATEKSVRELMTLTGAANLGVQAMQHMLPDLKQLVPDAPEEFWTDFMNEVNPDEMVTLIVPIYTKHFTEKEIQKAIKFYKSSTGQKFIQALPQVMQESMDVGRQWGQTLAQRVIDKANAKANAEESN